MEVTTNEEQNYGKLNEFPFAICPNCKSIQDQPILDSRFHTINLTCNKCKNKFCSYCGGDRHILMSCRKPLPEIKSVSNQYRV
ncbi:hypothetical protein SteCoe_34232 [Stentor coeruleus]|uniref:IBR domain-containing protein n=1 Tax=Stentor coeruleus TaxID=5963 RepID=A0A1R2AVC3_9CILI|nr:hypothetical protein SteCoe_34232 [Stentor coeruleus]